MNSAFVSSVWDCSDTNFLKFNMSFIKGCCLTTKVRDYRISKYHYLKVLIFWYFSNDWYYILQYCTSHCLMGARSPSAPMNCSRATTVLNKAKTYDAIVPMPTSNEPTTKFPPHSAVLKWKHIKPVVVERRRKTSADIGQQISTCL